VTSVTPPSFPQVRGVVFDLDGTLVHSALDFDAMRREMHLPAGQPVLEALAHLPEDEARRCRAILERHEWDGAERATLFAGVEAFVARLRELGIRQAVWTRNARNVTQRTLARLGMTFDRVVTRDDAPAKPDPTALWSIGDDWQVDRGELILIGDYVFDLEAARRAGIRGVLFTNDAEPHACVGHELADFHLRSFADVADLWRWMGHV
jgi:HAD superfamily hydrolase (TIGR01549 family)